MMTQPPCVDLVGLLFFAKHGLVFVVSIAIYSKILTKNYITHNNELKELVNISFEFAFEREGEKASSITITQFIVKSDTL